MRVAFVNKPIDIPNKKEKITARAIFSFLKTNDIGDTIFSKLIIKLIILYLI